MPVRIFISYRRDDSGATAGRLRERLVKEFGTNNVFMDVDSIPAGVDFAAHLQRTLETCQLVLALIGPNWLKVSNASGVRRIEDPSDFVRMELTAALCKSIKLVPVLIDGASMPSEAELPLPLKPLGKLQAIELRNSQFRWDAARLLEKLFEALGQSPRLRRQLKWLAAAIALSALGTAWSAIEYGWFGLTPRSMWIPAGFAAKDFRVTAKQELPPCDRGNSALAEPVPINRHGEANLALLNQATATASSVIPGFETRHQIDYLNDGWYNNCRSWIPASMPAWAELDLAEVFEIRQIVIGSEHTKFWGDRRLLEFAILTRYRAEDPWELAYRRDAKDGPVDSTTVFDIGTKRARYVRLDFTKTVSGDLPRVDELEIYGHRVN